MKFKFDILENSESGIIENGCKDVYNLDLINSNNFSEFVNYKPNKKDFVDKPSLSSALIVAKNTSYSVGKCLKDEIGYFQNAGNVVEKNSIQVSLTTATYSNLHGTHIVKNNINQVIQGFCARRLIQSDVWNSKDEYMKPSDHILQSVEYKQWSKDCIIYSLFDNASYQSSLRHVEYQNKKWDIVNEFFWQDINILKELADKHNFIEMIDDFDNHDKQRFVYQEIEKIKNEEITFSQDALDLLNFANDLIVKSFPFRKMLYYQKEEYHLNAWDCGYAQLKLVWKEFLKDDFKVFDDLRKKLANKLRPKVYEFGFLFE